ncbi:MAG: polyprenyl synthetase family protein [Euryarchaeota archaeon]|nr:polyprenyl synthetase family protein [Euryarchaeota archaeon]
MDDITLLNEIKKKSVKVNNFIEQKTFSKPLEPLTLHNACKHLFLAGGKRVRSAITLFSCEAAGGIDEWALPSAVAMELLHAYSLIHDDLIDRGTSRRGVPSVNIKYGEPAAILTGDILLTKVYESIGMTSEVPEVTVSQILRVMETVTKSSIDLCEGQTLDISFSDSSMVGKVDENDCLRMISKKTGSLVAAATKTGGILANAKASEILALEEYGRCFGTGYQIIDDVLDMIANKESFGKPVGGDLREGKCTLITVYAFNNAEKRELESILAVLGNRNPSMGSIQKAIEALHKCGAIEYAINTSEKYLTQAIDSLQDFPGTHEKEILTAFTPSLALKLAGVDTATLLPSSSNSKYW